MRSCESLIPSYKKPSSEGRASRCSDLLTETSPRRAPMFPGQALAQPTRTVAKRSLRSTRGRGSMMRQTATIFRGSLKSVQFTYDGCAGPRTSYVLSEFFHLVGTQVQSTI